MPAFTLMLTKFQALGIQLVHNIYVILRILKKHTMPRRHFEPKTILGPKLSTYIAKGTTNPKCWVLRHKVPTFSTTTNYKQANSKLGPNISNLPPNKTFLNIRNNISFEPVSSATRVTSIKSQERQPITDKGRQ